MRTWGRFLPILILSLACEKPKDGKDSTSTTQSKPTCEAARSCNQVAPVPDEAPFTLGLPSYCQTEALADSGVSGMLLICRPRAIDLIKEIASPPATFTVSDDCIYTEAEVKCSVVSDFDLVLTISPTGDREKIYDDIPNLADRIGRTLKVSESERELASKVLRVIVDNRTSLLNNVAVQDPFSGISEVQGVKSELQAEADAMWQGARRDNFDASKFVAYAAKIVQVIPEFKAGASDLTFATLEN